jgi:ubiquinone/menaquinone biosynthesis C-methylase UbiE
MPENYSGSVRSFWREKFGEIPDGARILDIATGNGAIATLAAEYAADRNKQFFITATDLATINSSVIENAEAENLRSNIVFRSAVPCETQPLEDDSCDLVTSQFGFEYSDKAATLTEMRRVLVPDGKFIAISHHADSSLIRSAAVELEIYELGLRRVDLFGKLRSNLTKLGDLGGTRNSVKRALREAAPEADKVSDAVQELLRQHPDNECTKQMIASAQHLIMGATKTTVDERLVAVGAIEMDLVAAEARLQDMVKASMGQEDIDQLVVTAKSSGFSTAHCLRFFTDDDQLVGWQIHIW